MIHVNIKRLDQPTSWALTNTGFPIVTPEEELFTFHEDHLAFCAMSVYLRFTGDDLFNSNVNNSIAWYITSYFSLAKELVISIKVMEA